jgi:hypothetical protein
MCSQGFSACIQNFTLEITVARKEKQPETEIRWERGKKQPA